MLYIDHAEDTGESATGPSRRRRGQRVLGWASIILSALLVVSALTAYGFYWRLQNNIRH